jgi:hypothetical protein
MPVKTVEGAFAIHETGKICGGNHGNFPIVSRMTEGMV